MSLVHKTSTTCAVDILGIEERKTLTALRDRKMPSGVFGKMRWMLLELYCSSSFVLGQMCARQSRKLFRKTLKWPEQKKAVCTNTVYREANFSNPPEKVFRIEIQKLETRGIRVCQITFYLHQRFRLKSNMLKRIHGIKSCASRNLL